MAEPLALKGPRVNATTRTASPACNGLAGARSRRGASNEHLRLMLGDEAEGTLLHQALARTPTTSRPEHVLHESQGVTVGMPALGRQKRPRTFHILASAASGCGHSQRDLQPPVQGHLHGLHGLQWERRHRVACPPTQNLKHFLVTMQ